MQSHFEEQGREIHFIRPLGKGGFGTVHLADVRSAGGLVQRMAVKLLHAEKARDLEIAARARDEARVMSQLNHDNVLKIYGLTWLDDKPAVLMEFVEGIDCAKLIKHSRGTGEAGLPLRVSLRIAECAASALNAGWTSISLQTGAPLRVIHRDIKPSNLMVSVHGAVKVMDFGVARGEFQREAHTLHNQFGTRRYMAPERWLNQELGSRSDVYSLGIALWEMVMGKRFAPLSLRREEFEEQRTQVLNDLATHPGIEAESARQCARIVATMLAYAPEERMSAAETERALSDLEASCAGVDLRRYARDQITSALAAHLDTLVDSALFQRSGTTISTRDPEASEVAPSVRVRRRASRPWLGAALLLLLLGGAWWAWPGKATDFDSPVPPVDLGASAQGSQVLQVVSLRVVADPSAGQLRVRDSRTDVGASVRLLPGRHVFEFRGGGWTARCAGLVSLGLSRIEFHQDREGCELY